MAAEKLFENKVKKFLEDEGCWFVKFFANAYTKSGIPDILCCCGGYFLGIEVKAPNGKPSPLQIHNLKKIHEAGGFGILLYPDNFELFKNLIYSIEESTIEEIYDTYAVLKGRWDK